MAHRLQHQPNFKSTLAPRFAFAEILRYPNLDGTVCYSVCGYPTQTQYIVPTLVQRR